MEKQYIELYKSQHETIKKHSSPLMNAVRDASFGLFEELGFPTSKLENYKYTDLTEPLSVDYGLNLNRVKIPVNPYEVFKCDVPGIHSYLYFVLNDGFYPVRDARNDDLPEGVVIGSLNEIAKTHPELVEAYYGKLSTTKKDGLIAFNGAFAQDGFFMYVPENVQLDKPVQLINIMRSDVDFMANSHNLIIIEKGAKAQLLVCDHTMDDVRFTTNRVTEVFVDENASYEHYKLENTHIKTTNLSTLLIEQKDSSNVLTNVMTLHNGITRNTIEIDVNGEHCETTLCGMVIADKKQQVDNFTSVIHSKPNCNSNELFKYVLDDNSKGGFTGKLYIAEPHRQDAHKTAARNLCRRCEMFARRHHRAARRKRNVLHAFARHSRKRSPLVTYVCLHSRCDRQHTYRRFTGPHEIACRKTIAWRIVEMRRLRHLPVSK